MSIILKGNNINNSNNNGITPEDPSATIRQYTDKITIIFQFRNVVEDNIQLTNINKCIVVKNENRIPLNVNDGEIICKQNIGNLGSSTGYRSVTINDTNVVIYKTYYYRFFIYDSSGACNSNVIKGVQFLKLDPILKNNTWEQIVMTVNNDAIPSTWKVGDEIDLDIPAYTGISAQTITLQIWGFKIFTKSDSTDKAKILFGMKNLTKDKYSTQGYDSVSATYYSSENWDTSYLRNVILKNIYNYCLPSALKNNIKSVKTFGYDVNTSGNIESEDKLFIPSHYEVLGYTNSKLSEGRSKITIFTDNNSRIKKIPEATNASEWPTRDRQIGVVNAYYYYIGEDGAELTGYVPNTSGICFCFNI